MGKIKIRGSANKEFKADIMKVNISISAFGETPASAISQGKKETEKVLQLLAGMGMDIAKVTMKSDTLSEPSRYDDEDFYYFEKRISFTTDANLAVIDSLSAGIANKKINATYNEVFNLSFIQSAKDEVLREALMNAKKKAEEIAGTLGKKVIGVEEIKGEDFEEIDNEELFCEKYFPGNASGMLAPQLSPDTVSIEKSINVIWIVE